MKFVFSRIAKTTPFIIYIYNRKKKLNIEILTTGLFTDSVLVALVGMTGDAGAELLVAD
jgi:hypothetical protein